MPDREIKNVEKKLAAERAVEFIKEIGRIVREGLKIKAVSTSGTTTDLARSEGINLISIFEAAKIDLTIDGADEVEKKSFNGIKGGGGALLFEKIVALSSKKNLWVIDSGKLVDKLGKFPLPVEIIPFGYQRVFKLLEERKFNPVIRMNGNQKYLTDSGNYIFDLNMRKIDDAKKLNDEIRLINGVVDTGLFIDIVDSVIVAKEGSVEILEKWN